MSPLDSLIAVDRPPTGMIPKRLNGLEKIHTDGVNCDVCQ